jgi:DNA modification methylase
MPTSGDDFRLLCGDALHTLATLDDESVQSVVTSPPYWQVRRYGVPHEIGCERSPDAYVARLANTFDELRRVLRNDGTLFVNIGDKYATSGGSGNQGRSDVLAGRAVVAQRSNRPPVAREFGMKPKDLIGIPWMLAFELRRRGWWWRHTLVWDKANCIPESMSDRPTTSHEYVLMFSKRRKYFYNASAAREPARSNAYDKRRMKEGRKRAGGKTLLQIYGTAAANAESNIGRNSKVGDGETRNWRSVWRLPSQRYRGAHFAVMPLELARRLVTAGSREGDVVLDPFNGAGTTALAALALGRRYVGIDAGESFLELTRERIRRAREPR